MQVREVLSMGHPVLRERSKPVAAFGTPAPVSETWIVTFCSQVVKRTVTIAGSRPAAARHGEP